MMSLPHQRGACYLSEDTDKSTQIRLYAPKYRYQSKKVISQNDILTTNESRSTNSS